MLESNNSEHVRKNESK